MWALWGEQSPLATRSKPKRQAQGNERRRNLGCDAVMWAVPVSVSVSVPVICFGVSGLSSRSRFRCPFRCGRRQGTEAGTDHRNRHGSQAQAQITETGTDTEYRNRNRHRNRKNFPASSRQKPKGPAAIATRPSVYDSGATQALPHRRLRLTPQAAVPPTWYCRPPTSRLHSTRF